VIRVAENHASEAEEMTSRRDGGGDHDGSAAHAHGTRGKGALDYERNEDCEQDKGHYDGRDRHVGPSQVT